MTYLTLPTDTLTTASALSPHTWPFSLEWLPSDAYLVGGSVRDALLGRQAEYLDLDFVLPEGAVATARAIANHYCTGYVLLDAERQIARAVFERATVDFAQQVGPTLEADLRRRDFTVNAIAYAPHTEQLFDPLNGYGDLQQRLIRMVAPENLKEDPLRLLRAYRQAAQLGFELEPTTRTTIQRLADLLGSIAPERVQAELNYLLGAARGTRFLHMAWDDGLFCTWLPHATATGMERVAQMDEAAIALETRWPVLGAELAGWLRDQQKVSGLGRSWMRIAKLTALVSPDAAEAEAELRNLKYSRNEIHAVQTVLRYLPQVPAVVQPSATAKEQYFFFQGVGAAFGALSVVALASGISEAAIAPLVARYLDPNDAIAHPHPLLTGRDLMTQLHLPPGPKIGQLLEVLQLARAEGKIATPAEALDLATHWMQQQSE